MKNNKITVDTMTFVRFWLVIIGLSAVIGAIFLARSAIITILISFFLALVLNRPVSFLARHLPGKSRVFATSVSYLVIVAVIVTIFFSVVPIITEQVSNFLKTLPDTIHSLQSTSNWLGGFLRQYNLEAGWNSWLKDLESQIGNIATNIGGLFINALNGLIGVILNAIFVSVLTFLILIEGPEWEEKFWRLLYSDKERRAHHQSIARKMYDVVSNYVSGQMMVAAISATMTAACVAILSQFFPALALPLALTAWLVIFMMLFVPIFGAFIGGGLVVLLLALYSWPAAVIYLVYFIIEQQIENNIVAPKIQSKRLNMSVLTVLIAIIVGWQVAGILGALVAIPVAGCVMVLVRDFMKRRHIKKTAANGEEIDASNEAPSIVIVFQTEKRQFVKPQLPHIIKKPDQK
ncbi:AI-2E family transporter [Candidatus Saccharibacteria bacterium]|nr:AI-2E family transporter [Candidatus Saccharibacteria bacterium]MCL1962996.1 AI-2E family transporter [Candidatus Saccharibacteria bacterium]